MYPQATVPNGSSTVNAASGPYDAEASASSPSTGTPDKGPICSSCSSSLRRGFPNSTLRNDMDSKCAFTIPGSRQVLKWGEQPFENKFAGFGPDVESALLSEIARC